MGSFNLRFKASVKKDLKAIPRKDVLRILEVVDGLANNPYPLNSKQLVGRDAWRVRIGVYRVIYTIDNQEVVIETIKVGHRKDVYR
jgi:mRNA interferase RelE/StbE